MSKAQYRPSNLKHKCPYCGKAFLWESQVRRHERVHTGERPYKCQLCHRGFIQVTDLVRHHRTHTQEKPYQCDICQKSFSQSGTLYKHRKLHLRVAQIGHQYKVKPKGWILPSSDTKEKNIEIHSGARIKTVSNAVKENSQLSEFDETCKIDKQKYSGFVNFGNEMLHMNSNGIHNVPSHTPHINACARKLNSQRRLNEIPTKLHTKTSNVNPSKDMDFIAVETKSGSVYQKSSHDEKSIMGIDLSCIKTEPEDLADTNVDYGSIDYNKVCNKTMLKTQIPSIITGDKDMHHFEDSHDDVDIYNTYEIEPCENSTDGSTVSHLNTTFENKTAATRAGLYSPPGVTSEVTAVTHSVTAATSSVTAAAVGSRLSSGLQPVTPGLSTQTHRFQTENKAKQFENFPGKNTKEATSATAAQTNCDCKQSTAARSEMENSGSANCKINSNQDIIGNNASLNCRQCHENFNFQNTQMLDHSGAENKVVQLQGEIKHMNNTLHQYLQQQNQIANLISIIQQLLLQQQQLITTVCAMVTQRPSDTQTLQQMLQQLMQQQQEMFAVTGQCQTQWNGSRDQDPSKIADCANGTFEGAH